MHVRTLLGDDAALLGEFLTDLDARLESVHAVETRSAVGDLAGLVHDGGHRQVVPQTHLEVVGVVRGGDLHRAGAELGIDVVVGDHRDLPSGERVVDRGADEVLVALVLGVHRDRGVTEHRLDTGGGDDDVRLVVVERAVAQRHEFAFDLLELDLDVGDRRLQHRRPVDQALGAVDQAVVVHALEDRLHGARETLVHREAIARPVDAVADTSHLALDGAAGLALPLPHLVDEQLAAEVFLRLAVDGELLLHHGLGRDARVVHAGEPQHLAALHALAAGQRVHQGVVERVTHVQAARDVRGRQHDRVAGLVACRVRLEVTGVHPPLIELGLDSAGVPALGEGICGILGVLWRTGHQAIVSVEHKPPGHGLSAGAGIPGHRRCPRGNGPQPSSSGSSSGRPRTCSDRNASITRYQSLVCWGLSTKWPSDGKYRNR